MACFTMEPGQEPVLVWSAELDENKFIDPIRWELANNPGIRIVCERFTITQETAKKSQAPFSLEQIGNLKQAMRDAGIPVTEINLQAPRDAKAMFPNPALKKLDYWHKGGAGHAMDAIRHGLLYLARNGWKPTRLLD